MQGLGQRVVLLFPGQGSQKPGMAKDLAGAFPIAKEVLGDVDAALGRPLSRLMFEGPADELTLTDNAQPALLAHGVAVWSVVKKALAGRVVAAAGHSLGEFTAYQAAAALTPSDAVRLVAKRGELMRAAGDARPGAMAAILGELAEPIDGICARATAEAGSVVPANFNSPEQTVISGEVAGVERAMVLAKERGAKRALRLPVSGAFHSPLMEPSVPGLSVALDKAEFAEAQFPIYANVDAQPSTSPIVARDKLLRQLTSPVRWLETIRALGAAFPDALYVELGPGGVLTGLVKRIMPTLQTATCGTAADVEALLR